MAEADVVIVGGGPAGLAAAAAAGLAGLRTVLLERRPSPVDVPGETLHPGLEPALASIGAAWALHAASPLRHLGIWVDWGGDGPRFVPYGEDRHGPWRGFQAHRRTLQALLLHHARACGVEVRQGWRALDPLVEAGRVTGVLTEQGPVAARVVIDASGGRHWLARRLGLGLRQLSPRLIAAYGYCEGAPAPGARPAGITAAGCGWSWTARVDDERWAWVALPLGPTRERPDRPAALARLTRASPTRGADVSWRALEAPGGRGYFACGDAAAVLDPASSHGVLRAVASGVRAARLARAVITGRLGETDAHAIYADALERQVAADRAGLSELYARLTPRPPWLGTPPVAARPFEARPAAERDSRPPPGAAPPRRSCS